MQQAGYLTAFFGNTLAVFQSDYSSMADDVTRAECVEIFVLTFADYFFNCLHSAYICFLPDESTFSEKR